MTLPTTLNALVVVALIFVPGIIFGQLIRRSIAHFPESVDARHFLAMGASGLFLHALVYPIWTRWIVDWYLAGTLQEHWLSMYLWFVFTTFLWPVLVGVIVALVIPWRWVDWSLDKVGLGYTDRTPSAWDHIFASEEGVWMKVYLQDGKVIAGKYGKASFASLHSRRRDLYIQKVYQLEDDRFGDEVEDSAGVWIPHDAITRIEIFKVTSGEV